MKKTLWILGSLLTLLLLLGGLFTFFELRSFAGATRATSMGDISTENSYLLPHRFELGQMLRKK